MNATPEISSSKKFTLQPSKDRQTLLGGGGAISVNAPFSSKIITILYRQYIHAYLDVADNRGMTERVATPKFSVKDQLMIPKYDTECSYPEISISREQMKRKEWKKLLMHAKSEHKLPIPMLDANIDDIPEKIEQQHSSSVINSEDYSDKETSFVETSTSLQQKQQQQSYAEEPSSSNRDREKSDLKNKNRTQSPKDKTLNKNHIEKLLSDRNPSHFALSSSWPISLQQQSIYRAALYVQIIELTCLQLKYFKLFELQHSCTTAIEIRIHYLLLYVRIIRFWEITSSELYQKIRKNNHNSTNKNIFFTVNEIIAIQKWLLAPISIEIQRQKGGISSKNKIPTLVKESIVYRFSAFNKLGLFLMEDLELTDLDQKILNRWNSYCIQNASGKRQENFKKVCSLTENTILFDKVLSMFYISPSLLDQELMLSSEYIRVAHVFANQISVPPDLISALESREIDLPLLFMLQRSSSGDDELIVSYLHALQTMVQPAMEEMTIIYDPMSERQTLVMQAILILLLVSFTTTPSSKFDFFDSVCNLITKQSMNTSLVVRVKLNLLTLKIS